MSWGAPDTEPTRLVLLRHGQTPLSVERRFAGRGDVPLTEEGHSQARSAARRLSGWGIDVVVSSPLSRGPAAPPAPAGGRRPPGGDPAGGGGARAPP